ncbi:Gfo/Idh/MocA family protein [Natronobiforma cellulositropha]|uniref:Gfo/Idh/MocA family protein n=1 Tax=Natronobiforma cellulositropha TaxID=1679076 RepID=UPI0021D5B352|nr:Gfo/Idh/MocA family oxidoreductase [Natronobiforma cellulositropha]
MASYDVAFIGTGSTEDLENPNRSGFAMNYYHAEGYEALENCALVACADVVPERAAAFAEAFDIDAAHTYETYGELLAETEPDIVSISVWPELHAEVVVDCARTESVQAIHCEKPMALTWGGARRMAAVADEEDVQLTFNHMRRFKPTWVEARERVRSGAIGDLERIELSPGNVYDGGTHEIDFAFGVADESPARWVIGQIDYREENVWFGAHNENQAYALWEHENGVVTVVSTGPGADLIPASMRFSGSEGVLEVAPADAEGTNTLRWRRQGESSWTRRTVEEGRWTDPVGDAVAHVVDCLETGEEPAIGAANALNATEVIFGIWESARRRGRVDLPLEIDDNPLHDLVESGALTPEPAEE